MPLGEVSNAAAGLKITASNDVTIILEGYHAVKVAEYLARRTGLDITILESQQVYHVTVRKFHKDQLELNFGPIESVEQAPRAEESEQSKCHPS